nr:glutamine synthetase type III [Chitinophagaceae bacterium]
ESKNILFEGDNYSEAWANEAAKRGLSNNKDTVKALDILADKSSVDLFKRLGIFTPIELEARHEIQLEEYIKKVQIEARMVGYISSNHILPAAVAYQNKLIENVKGLKEIGLKPETYRSQIEIIEVVSNHINNISDNVEAMIADRKKANEITDTHKRALAYAEIIRPYFDKIRYHADKLELIVEDGMWALPKYRELLFLR